MNLDAGRLVAVNVLSARSHLLDHEAYVKQFIDNLVTAIDMIPLTEVTAIRVPPNACSINDPHADDGGITAQVVISTSHIAYHSWPLQNRFRLVVDSCKDFSAEDVISVVHRFFPVKSYSVQDLKYKSPTEMIHGSEEKQAEVFV
jgi:S-adenosylmethionine/arginine decarboxylase-like enzyme